jgi:hypothetical protein
MRPIMKLDFGLILVLLALLVVQAFAPSKFSEELMKLPHRSIAFFSIALSALLAPVMAHPALAQTANVYIAQSAAGAGNGADCADAYAVTFFNSSSNWGTSSSKIGPGTTVHLCGTITAPAGSSNYLVVHGSGSSGNPITIHFEANAILTAPYWSGAVIDLNGSSYVTVDGGTNGVIQATANGTNLANQQDGGICVNNGTPQNSATNLTVQNLTCSNIYVDASVADNGGGDTYGFDIWNTSNLVIQNNTIHDVKWAIRNSYAVGSTYTNALTLTGNTIYDMDHCYFMTDSNSSGSAVASGFYIYGNSCGSMTNWDNTADDNHHDWFHLNANSTSSRFSNFFIYNNKNVGDVGANGNAGLFTNEGGQTTANVSGVYFFNNIFVNTSTTHCFADGFISWAEGGALTAANNTFIGRNGSCVNNGNSLSGDNGIAYESGSVSLSLENNIMQTMGSTFFYANGSQTSMTTANNNDYYTGGGWTWMSDGNTSAFSTWKSWCSCDSSSTTSNPSLTAAYHLPNSSSSAWQKGANLYQTCNGQPNPGLGALCYDASGVSRPSTGSWDIGAYEDSAGLQPQPPTGLTAAVSVQ